MPTVSTTARPPGGRLDQRRIPQGRPRYLREAIYASGWGDGFEQCRSMARSEERRRFEERQWDDRDDDWQRDRDRALARALRER